MCGHSPNMTNYCNKLLSYIFQTILLFKQARSFAKITENRGVSSFSPLPCLRYFFFYHGLLLNIIYETQPWMMMILHRNFPRCIFWVLLVTVSGVSAQDEEEFVYRRFSTMGLPSPSSPSGMPSDVPSRVPSDIPSMVPSDIPSMVPSLAPTQWPTKSPMMSLGSDYPSIVPTGWGTPKPTTTEDVWATPEMHRLSARISHDRERRRNAYLRMV